ncbi:MAG: hypothetical protein GKR88_00730 [Flavobacteriaceae bacterium]|nr:MAG: hypothetical protein GKR88_00730 [Flavobacteriaceae bacterium]
MDQIQMEIGVPVFGFRLLQLEVGVNLNLTNNNFTSKDVIGGLLLHIRKPFQSQYTKSEGSYKVCKHNRYLFKIYDKGMHRRNKDSGFDKDILRIEIAFKKMRDLNNLGIFNVNDLVNFDFNSFKSLLLNKWSRLLLFDKKALKGCKNEYLYSNLRWWQERSVGGFKYHKGILNNLSLKKELTQILETKIDELI